MCQRSRCHHHVAGRHPDGFRRHEALGIGSNIMSLGGIAIAIGAMIDGASS